MQQFFALFPAFDANQALVVGVSFILLYFLFFALRDIFLRTHSSLYQIACILLVATLPVVGFLLYFLVRPARTIKEREIGEMLTALAAGKKSFSSRFHL